MRGYNLSSRPAGVAPYAADKLADDVRRLIRERGAESALVVGHDWGGTVAWYTAMNHPEVVDRLAILNAAHPRKLSHGLRNPGQLRKSWYFFFFELPELPEAIVHADRWRFFRHFLRDARPPYQPRTAECRRGNHWIGASRSGMSRPSWFRSLQETHEGRIWAGGVEKEVTFAETDRDIDGAIDAARCHGHGADSSGK